jgi:hypothetical protein
MKIASKSSFTLFELLIVILIISIIYAIFVQKLSDKKSVLKSKGIESIKEILQSYDFNKSAKIVCIKKCKECIVYVDGKKIEEIDSPFTSKPKVYDYDIYGLLSEIEFVPIFDKNGNPQEVCFEYKLYANKSNSSYIVQYKDAYYLFFAYLNPVKKVDSIEEAQDIYDPSQWVPTDSGEYNF